MPKLENKKKQVKKNHSEKFLKFSQIEPFLYFWKWNFVAPSLKNTHIFGKKNLFYSSLKKNFFLNFGKWNFMAASFKKVLNFGKGEFLALNLKNSYILSKNKFTYFFFFSS